MNLEELRLELEQDLEWREAELRYLMNALVLDRKSLGASGQLTQSATETGLRVLVVMSQAHTEGFAQVSFEAYVRYLNSLNVVYGEMRPVLAVASLKREFQRLADGAEHDLDGLMLQLGLNSDSPEDRKAIKRQLSRIEAKHAFVETVRELDSRVCRLDRDVVDFEMNISRAVLLRMLYTLGIDSSRFDSREGHAIDAIRKARNDVAHGGRHFSRSASEVEEQLEYANRFREELVRVICDAASSESWRRVPRAAGQRSV